MAGSEEVIGSTSQVDINVLPTIYIAAIYFSI